MSTHTDTQTAETYVETYSAYLPDAQFIVYVDADGALIVCDVHGNQTHDEISPEDIAQVAGPTLQYRHAAILSERLGRDVLVVNPWAAWPVEDRPNRAQTGL